MTTMKLYHSTKKALVLSLGLLALSSCNLLDREPLDQVSPEVYYQTVEQVGAFPINYYASIFPGHGHGRWNAGLAVIDNGTDNQATTTPNRSTFSNEEWKVGSTGQPNIAAIRNVNVFFQNVLPKYKAGKISGNADNLKHYIGEAYVIRAMLYYDALQNYGDFPILTEDNLYKDTDDELLLKASQRKPRNEVARFILQDLDKAIELLRPSYPGNQRLTKKAAQLLKSRIALYEGTFELHHRGSGRVPGDANWPGKDKEWNKGKTFDQQGEVTFFLTEAKNAAKVVADAVQLVPNTHKINPDLPAFSGWNSYYEMFASRDLSGYPEILLWRQYNKERGIVHLVSHQLISGTNSGWTRGLVESFLMKDGKPYYAKTGSYTDETLEDVKKDRDERLQLFIFDEKSPRFYQNGAVQLYESPNMIDKPEVRDVTGYAQRKYYNYDPAMRHGSEMNDVSGVPILRASEAYLNYIEASYELTKTLDTDARKYWDALRQRAGITGTIDQTIAATDMTKETTRASYDWGAFSAGKAVDATLYSIRRERRCEFAGEGMRWDDLVRWCALDQVKNYQIEGVNFWTKIHTYKYFQEKDKQGNVVMENGQPKARFVANGSSQSTISSKDLGVYHHPYQVISKANNNVMYDGYTFYLAHYLHPVTIQTLELCSPTGKVEDAYFYQNINWPTDTKNPYALK